MTLCCKVTQIYQFVRKLAHVFKCLKTMVLGQARNTPYLKVVGHYQIPSL